MKIIRFGMKMKYKEDRDRIKAIAEEVLIKAQIIRF